MVRKAPRLSRKRLHEMYRVMLRIRRFEETADDMYMAGKVVGGVHVSIGQEACSAGLCAALEENDAVLTTHRGHGHSIAKGTRLPEMLAELMGKATGLCRSKGGSMHIADVSKGHYGAHSVVGANMPMAAGIGLAYQLEGKGRVAVVFFGDGASNNGAFHEAMNLCAIWKLPVVFFCENNQYAVSVPAAYSTAVEDISVRAKGYDAPGVTIDGMDAAAVYEASREAVAHARRGAGPSLVEAKTYRFFGHSRGDPHYGMYRTKEEWEGWKERDPLLVCEKMLGMSAREKSAHAEAVEAEIQEAIAFAEASPEPEESVALEDIFA